MFPGHPGQKKFARPHLQKSLAWWCVSVIPVTIHIMKKDHAWSMPTWTKKWDPVSKITRAKRIGGIAQAVEYLPSKCKPWVRILVLQRKKYRRGKTQFLLNSHSTMNSEDFCDQIGGEQVSNTSSKQSVLQGTTAECPPVQFHSNTIYVKMLSDPTGWGLRPTKLPHHHYLPCLSQAPGCFTCVSDWPAINWGPMIPSWGISNLLIWLTDLRKTFYLLLLIHHKGY
jgi:hypothetical protein